MCCCTSSLSLSGCLLYLHLPFCPLKLVQSGDQKPMQNPFCSARFGEASAVGPSRRSKLTSSAFLPPFPLARWPSTTHLGLAALAPECSSLSLDGLVLILLRGFVLLPVAGSVDRHPPVRRRGVLPRPAVCRLRQRTSPPLPSLAFLRTLCSLLSADGLLAAFAAFQETNPFLTLVPTPLTATHVVLDPTLPLINLPLRDHLESLGRGIEIVTLEWVKQSMRADRTADVDEYRLAPTGGPGARELARQVNGKGKERERTR